MQRQKTDTSVSVPKPDPERLYSIKDVADRLRLCYRSVHRAVREGRIQSVRLGGAVRISAGELQRICSKGF